MTSRYDSTFHVTETPALTTRPSVTSTSLKTALLFYHLKKYTQSRKGFNKTVSKVGTTIQNAHNVGYAIESYSAACFAMQYYSFLILDN